MFEKLMSLLCHPQNAFFKAWRKLGWGSFERRLRYDVFARTHYAFCIYHAARTASVLKIPAMSVIEFGVAGGNGLVAAEAIAVEVEKLFPIQIEIYGFDSGEGLPPPQGYRDLPYVWQEGFFKMDVPALESRLQRSKLVLGNVSDTTTTFFQDHSAAPLGAVFFDLDYYSSTRDAFRLFDAGDEHALPRVFCYMDDILSNEFGGLYCHGVGQLCAIDEYNAEHEDKCLAPIAGLAHSRRRRRGLE